MIKYNFIQKRCISSRRSKRSSRSSRHQCRSRCHLRSRRKSGPCSHRPSTFHRSPCSRRAQSALHLAQILIGSLPISPGHISRSPRQIQAHSNLTHVTNQRFSHLKRCRSTDRFGWARSEKKYPQAPNMKSSPPLAPKRLCSGPEAIASQITILSTSAHVTSKKT